MNAKQTTKALALGLLACAGSTFAAISSVTFSVNNSTRVYTYTRGVAIANDTITAATMAAIPTGCSIAPALPAGLTLTEISTTQCVISGTPTATSPTTPYQVNLRAGSGTDSLPAITITVGPVTNLSYGQAMITGTVGKPFVAISPALGLTSGSISYHADSALPAGVTLVAGVLAGTPTAAFAGRAYVVTATNGTDSTTARVYLSVKAAAPSYSTWTGHKAITITTTGLGLGAAVANFPVLVRLGHGNADVFANSKGSLGSLAGAVVNGGNGADIRFTTSDTLTDLPYQIERWDSAQRTAEIWVNVPSVAATGATTILMHYGKTGQTTTSSGAGVFATANGYQGVWHMNGGSGDEKDATANGLVATNAGGATNQTAGTIGLAKSFDGGSNYLDVANSATGALNFAQNSTWTISTWTTSASGANRVTLVAKGNQQYALQTSYNTTNITWEAVEYSNFLSNVDGSAISRAGWPHAYSATTDIVPGAWTHLVEVRNAGLLQLYVNSVLVGTSASGAWDANGTTARGLDADVGIGAMIGEQTSNLTGVSRYWAGDIDEVQMANAARDSNWVKLSYQSQKAGSTVTTVAGTTAIEPGMAASGAAQGSFTAKNVGGNVMFSMPAHTVAGKLSVVDVWGRSVWSANVAANSRTLTWNGLAANGHSLSQGMYLVRLTAPGAKSWETKMVYTR